MDLILIAAPTRTLGRLVARGAGLRHAPSAMRSCS
jgi:hypothetical protein